MNLINVAFLSFLNYIYIHFQVRIGISEEAKKQILSIGIKWFLSSMGESILLFYGHGDT